MSENPDNIQPEKKEEKKIDPAEETEEKIESKKGEKFCTSSIQVQGPTEDKLEQLRILARVYGARLRFDDKSENYVFELTMYNCDSPIPAQDMLKKFDEAGIKHTAFEQEKKSHKVLKM